ncbi:MAG: S1 RNA-binding domain-containing protein, partial [Planctomycetota bacterium]
MVAEKAAGENTDNLAAVVEESQIADSIEEMQAAESQNNESQSNESSEAPTPQQNDTSEPSVEVNEKIDPPALPVAVPKQKLPRLSKEQVARRKDLVKLIRDLNSNELADQLKVGRLLMRDIVHAICRPEYDPRNNVNRPVFRSGIIKIDDLKVDMALDAQVVNVVDFGVFVDIGLGTSCLVHVSQLADYFIRDPHRFFAVGDFLKVWVTEVDSAQRRVRLTAVQPASLRPKKAEKQTRPNRKGKFKKPGKFSNSNRKGHKPKAKPKPVKPITDGMLKGAEPMTSFSDLAQFFDKKSVDKKSDKGKQ